MHILQVIDSLSMGGAERLLIMFAQQAKLHKVKLTILGLHDDIQTPILDELISTKVKIKKLPAGSLFSPRRFFLIYRFIQQERFDVIQTHLTYANTLGSLAGWLAGIPVVATLHSAHFRPAGMEGMRDQIECWILKHITREVIAVGRSVAESYQTVLGNTKIQIILNAVQPFRKTTKKEMVHARRKISIPDDSLIILAVGRTVFAKGYDDLIEAARRIHPYFPQVHVVVIGNGSLLSVLSRKVTNLKMDDYFHFLGERTDVPVWMAASDIFVSSSHWEGMPLSVLEAKMAGMPIVATQVGDLPDIIHPDFGVLVPPRNPNKLSEALLGLLTDPTKCKKMSLAARNQAKKDLSASAWFMQMMDLYRQLVKTKEQGNV
jgi:glycosyltransferase involved in cell wall biosynthesis